MEELNDLKTAIIELKLHTKDEFMFMNMIAQIEDKIELLKKPDDDMLSKL
jgi:hypothetical protein